MQLIRRELPVVLIEICGGFNFDQARPADRARIYGTILRLEDEGYMVQRLSTWDYIGIPAAA